MRKLILSIIVFACFSSLFAIENDKETIMSAMRDEIKRSMKELHLSSLKTPYYIEYQIVVNNPHEIKSVLGSLINSEVQKSIVLNTTIRVGNYKFDNTNFFDVGLSFFGSGDDEERFKRRQLPIELDYETLRRELWLATDAAYKQSAEIYSKKEATLKNRIVTDTITEDFSKIIPEKNFKEKEIPKFDVNYFENVSKEMSEVFLKYKDIFNSSVGIEYLPKTIYYVNSEGMEYSKTELYYGIETVAYSQAKDGMPLANHFVALAKDVKDLPSKDSLVKGAKKCAEKLNEIINSPKLIEAYSGPIIFEGNAAGEAIAQIFAPNLVSQRSPLTESGMQDNDRNSSFQNKIGGRVMPEFISIDDSPLTSKIGNTGLIGNYNIDDEGVLTKDVTVVKDGYLKLLLNSRIPTKRLKESNARCRGGAAIFSNLILKSKDDKKLSNSELKSKLLKLVKDRDLPFGIIIRKIINQNIMFTSLYRASNGNFEIPRNNTSLSVIEAYKIYPDGKEELVRGGLVAGITPQTFKDIVFVGNLNFTLNLLSPSVVSSFISGGDQFIGTSITTPDILLEDCELKANDSDFKKLPYLSNPFIQ
jgi:hypothetical protein